MRSRAKQKSARSGRIPLLGCILFLVLVTWVVNRLAQAPAAAASKPRATKAATAAAGGRGGGPLGAPDKAAEIIIATAISILSAAGTSRWGDSQTTRRVLSVRSMGGSFGDIAWVPGSPQPPAARQGIALSAGGPGRTAVLLSGIKGQQAWQDPCPPNPRSPELSLIICCTSAGTCALAAAAAAAALLPRLPLLALPAPQATLLASLIWLSLAGCCS